jgi:hypothetical protein
VHAACSTASLVYVSNHNLLSQKLRHHSIQHGTAHTFSCFFFCTIDSPHDDALLSSIMHAGCTTLTRMAPSVRRSCTACCSRLWARA